MECEGLKNKFVSKLDFSAGNLSSAWTRFKGQFKIYALAKSQSKLAVDEQIANMLLCMGQESVEIYNQFVYDDDQHKLTLANVISDFDRHFQPVKNVIYERMIFHQISQKPSQSIHQFITETQSQVIHCDYGDMANEMVRDRIVVGVRDHKLRECLVDMENLDLQRCVQKAKQFTSSRAQMAHMVPDNLDAVTKETERRRLPFQRSSGRPEGASSKECCHFCGKEKHPRDQCPARKSVCNRCQEEGHWRRGKACSGKRKQQNKTVHEVAEEGVTEVIIEEDSDLYLGTISA